MDTKQYLMQISRLDRMIQNKISEIAQFRELSYGISAIKNEERVQTSPYFDKIGRTLSKIEEMESKLDAMIDDFVDKKSLIIEQIDSMDNETYYEVLFARYIEKKTFERISADMNYSFRNITRVHGKALKEFERKYGHTYLNLS